MSSVCLRVLGVDIGLLPRGSIVVDNGDRVLGMEVQVDGRLGEDVVGM